MRSTTNHGPTSMTMNNGHRGSNIGEQQSANHLGDSGGMTHNLSGIGLNATHAMGNINI